MVGQYVEVSGIVTAVGTQKDAYPAAYYYIQMPTGSEYAGLEVFKESHTYTRGMALTVKGVIRESYGVTELVECFSTVTASSVSLPAPVAVFADIHPRLLARLELHRSRLIHGAGVHPKDSIATLRRAGPIPILIERARPRLQAQGPNAVAAV